MHEFAIAQSLLEIIKKGVSPYQGAKVTRIKLKIGKLSGVLPDALSFAFEALSKGGIAEGAVISVEETSLKIKCRGCGESSIMDDPFLVCPRCGGFAVDTVQGRELEIKEMEITDEG